jgi:hypothetical protein
MPKKRKVSEDTWSKIAEEAISEAEAVECDGKAFARGLAEMVDVIASRRDQANEEFGVDDDDDDDDEVDDELGPAMVDADEDD